MSLHAFVRGRRNSRPPRRCPPRVTYASGYEQLRRRKSRSPTRNRTRRPSLRTRNLARTIRQLPKAIPIIGGGHLCCRFYDLRSSTKRKWVLGLPLRPHLKSKRIPTVSPPPQKPALFLQFLAQALNYALHRRVASCANLHKNGQLRP